MPKNYYTKSHVKRKILRTFWKFYCNILDKHTYTCSLIKVINSFCINLAIYSKSVKCFKHLFWQAQETETPFQKLSISILKRNNKTNLWKHQQSLFWRNFIWKFSATFLFQVLLYSLEGIKIFLSVIQAILSWAFLNYCIIFLGVWVLPECLSDVLGHYSINILDDFWSFMWWAVYLVQFHFNCDVQRYLWHLFLAS